MEKNKNGKFAQESLHVKKLPVDEKKKKKSYIKNDTFRIFITFS